MRIKSLGLKISLIVALIIVIIIVGCYSFLSANMNYLVNDLTDKEARFANAALTKAVEDAQNEAYVRALIIANEPSIAAAILNNDMVTLKKNLDLNMPGLDLITLCDTDGNVLARGHNNQTGDNVLSQKTLTAALQTGNGTSTIEAGNTVGLSARGSAAIKDPDGNIIGAVVCGSNLANEAFVDDIKSRNNCEVTIFDGDTRMNTTLLDEKGNRVIGTKASDAVIQTVIDQRKDYALHIELFGSQYAAYYSPLLRDDSVIGMLFVGVNIDDTMSALKAMLHKMLLMAIMAIIISIVLVFLFSLFSVSKPLQKIGVLAQKIKTGDIGVSTNEQMSTGIRSSDEIGVLAMALEQAYTQLRGYVGEIKERMQGLDDGDLRTESTYDFQGDFVLIKDSINSIIRNQNQIMTEVSQTSTQVSTGAKQVADSAQLLAQGSTEQAASIEELSSSIAEISERTKANADMANRAAKLADTIRDNAEKGSSQMDDMISAVKDINRSSQNISNVIKVIDDIAFQTNILALNAAVEAARAGQHGKGFAVVAEEVRNLASKSAEAAKDTGVMIQDSMEKAELGSKIAGETALSLTEIVNGINESNQLVGDIATSSEEQSFGIAQINTGIDQVAQVVMQNSATAEESAAASEEMSSQADVLRQLIERFKLE